MAKKPPKVSARDKKKMGPVYYSALVRPVENIGQDTGRAFKRTNTFLHKNPIGKLALRYARKGK